MDKVYAPQDIERRIYERWESHGWFAPRASGAPYCIMIPPPNVTGTLHMGHAFQHTLMDALTRYHRMLGRATLWQPGTDHAGIATQMVVERELLKKEGKSRHDLGREEFLKKLTGSNPQMESLLKQILSEDALKEMADPTFAAVPNAAKKVGESWEKTSKLDMGPIGRYENTYKYTYEGPDKDKKWDKIKVETTLKYTPPDPKAPGGGLPFKIVSATLASKNAGGTISFNAEKGRVEESNMKVQLVGGLNIEIGGAATAVKLDQTQTTTVKTSDTNPNKK